MHEPVFGQSSGKKQGTKSKGGSSGKKQGTKKKRSKVAFNTKALTGQAGSGKIVLKQELTIEKDA